MASLLQQIETVPVGSLELYPGNPRRGDVSVIADSLRENEQYAPLVVQRSTRYVLAGNHTLKAAVSLGWPEIDVVFVDVDDQRARKILLSANRTAELPGPDGFRYDDDELVQLLSYLEDDYEGTGWTAEDVDALIGAGEELPAGGGDPDDAPEPPAEPVSSPGDLWRIGPHRLLVGDATDMAAVEAMLAGDRCDCMWTDPPYGVEYVGKTKNALTIRNDGAADLAGLLAGAWAVATAALKPGAAFYIAHPPGALYRTFGESIAEAGWIYRQGLVWVKNAMVLGHSDYHFKHEPVMFGYTDGSEGRRGRGGNGWYGDDSQTSVFMIDKPPRSEDHPTMKPVSLVTAMLVNSCPPHGLVYEPFSGSGTTLIAAHSLGMRAAAVEIDARYADVTLKRAETLLGMRVLPDGTTEPVSFT